MLRTTTGHSPRAEHGDPKRNRSRIRCRSHFAFEVCLSASVEAIVGADEGEVASATDSASILFGVAMFGPWAMSCGGAQHVST